jgi:hypothetical protein
VFERIFLPIVQKNISNIKRQKPRSPDLIGTRMSEDTISAIDFINNACWKVWLKAKTIEFGDF